ncbi:MAG: hypothetical protein LBL65_02045 [Campylobacteraceae bacterium]|jgi:uncharacterized protein YkvS|nr:hypothetical protein [Campylobacteraceae bacterium]
MKKTVLMFLIFACILCAVDKNMETTCKENRGKVIEILDKDYKRQSICTNEINNETMILGILYIKNNEDLSFKKDTVVPHCEMSDNLHLFIEEGADISHLTLQDNSSIEMEEASSISHINLYGKSKAAINGGNVSFLNLNDDAVAHIYGININGGSYMSQNVKVIGGVVTYSPNSTIHIYANNVVFEGGKLSGLWQNGKHFSFWLIEKKPDKRYKYNEPHAGGYALSSIPIQMPKQVVVHKAEKF